MSKKFVGRRSLRCGCGRWAGGEASGGGGGGALLSTLIFFGFFTVLRLPIGFLLCRRISTPSGMSPRMKIPSSFSSWISSRSACLRLIFSQRFKSRFCFLMTRLPLWWTSGGVGTSGMNSNLMLTVKLLRATLSSGADDPWSSCWSEEAAGVRCIGEVLDMMVNGSDDLGCSTEASCLTTTLISEVAALDCDATLIVGVAAFESPNFSISSSWCRPANFFLMSSVTASWRDLSHLEDRDGVPGPRYVSSGGVNRSWRLRCVDRQDWYECLRHGCGYRGSCGGRLGSGSRLVLRAGYRENRLGLESPYVRLLLVSCVGRNPSLGVKLPVFCWNRCEAAGCRWKWFGSNQRLSEKVLKLSDRRLLLPWWFSSGDLNRFCGIHRSWSLRRWKIC